MNKRKIVANEEIEKLSNKQKQLRIAANLSKDPEETKKLKKERNAALHEIKKLQIKAANEEIATK